MQNQGWGRFREPSHSRPLAFNNRNIMKYTFNVTIYLTYFDETYQPEIELSDREIATIKELLSCYSGDLDEGLMPVLEDGPQELYDKFYDAIFPHVFIAIYNDECQEAGVEHRPYPEEYWDDDEVRFLISKHKDDYEFDGSYICDIPDDWRPTLS